MQSNFFNTFEQKYLAMDADTDNELRTYQDKHQTTRSMVIVVDAERGESKE